MTIQGDLLKQVHCGECKRACHQIRFQDPSEYRQTLHRSHYEPSRIYDLPEGNQPLISGSTQYLSSFFH